MASTYYFQIKIEQALAALETAMDLDRLQVYHVSMNFYINPFLLTWVKAKYNMY